MSRHRMPEALTRGAAREGKIGPKDLIVIFYENLPKKHPEKGKRAETCPEILLFSCFVP